MKNYEIDMEVPIVFQCSLCFFLSEDHDVMLRHLEETHTDEVKGQNLEYFIMEVSREYLARQPEPETPEEEPLEEEFPEGKAYSEREMKLLKLMPKLINNWESLSEYHKKAILSLLMGSSTDHWKEIDSNLSSLGYEKGYLMRILQKIENGRCPICDLDHEKLGSTNLVMDENFEEFKKALILNHMAKEHTTVYNLMVGKQPIEDPFKKRVPISQVVSGNPEQCAEKLTKRELELEQLASEIASCPKKREELFRLWIKSKQKRE